MALWKLAEEQFDAEFVIKVDDDNYVRLDRLTHAIDQWNGLGAGARHRLTPLYALDRLGLFPQLLWMLAAPISAF